MAINKAEQSLEDKLTRDIKELKDEILALKTHPQPIGADGISMTYGTASTSLTLAAGAALTAGFIFTPTSDFVFNLYDFLLTIYVDVYDSAYAYSGGTSLTTAQRTLNLESWCDYLNSRFTAPFSRQYRIRVRNNDVSTHTYYIDMSLIYPKLIIA